MVKPVVVVIRYAFYLYLSVAINVLSHETGHYLAAHVLKISVDSIEIGPRIMAINLGKFRISPLVYKGRIIIDGSFKTWISATVFYLSGVFGNLFVLLMSLHVCFWPLKALLQIIAIAQIIGSLIPIPGSDISKLIRMLKS